MGGSVPGAAFAAGTALCHPGRRHHTSPGLQPGSTICTRTGPARRKGFSTVVERSGCCRSQPPGTLSVFGRSPEGSGEDADGDRLSGGGQTPDGHGCRGGCRVLQALAIAGGLTPDASSDRIFVLRQKPSPVRIRFTYEALVHQQPAAINFRLRSGDVVLVE